MGKYFKYAIGEIVLVVIGILIALQINNWNEQRKINKEQAQLIKSIKADLEADIEMISSFLNTTKDRQSKIFAESEKISQASFELDSLVSFVRNDVFAYFRVFEGFNNNTYNSAKSSGKIEIIEDKIKRELFDLSVMQERISNTDNNYYEVHLKATNDFMRQYPINLPFTYIKKGSANELMWSKISRKDLTLRLNFWGTTKTNLYRIRMHNFKEVLEKTEAILKMLESKYD